MDTTHISQRKRKAVVDADDHQTLDRPGAPSSSPVFALVPDDCWYLVSSFSNPPDVYNLSLSSKHFFRATTSEEESSSAPLLATRLLRQSLLTSLGRVLRHSASGITLESALALADLPEGSALIAGSTMAQACLGVLWKGEGYDQPVDVDVYCTAHAAPQVRSWLVEQASCMFCGFNDYRISMTSDELLYTVDTNIHHVESWGSIIENLEREEGVHELKNTEYYKDTEYYKEASKWGKDCQQNYVDRKWRHTMSFEELGIDHNMAYNIKPKLGGDLPFDFHGDGSIDLIVARIKTKGGASSLLEDFDLTICKASFDGKTFRIPDPHRTFSAKSTMEPNRRAVVESYVKHFKSHSRQDDSVAASISARITIMAVRKDVPNAPFYRQLDVAARLPDRFTGDDWGPGSMWDPLVQAKYSPSIQFHNWTLKLINRLRKYQQRGIEVISAPTIDDGVRIDRIYPDWG